MGDNAVNTMAEKIAPEIAAWIGEREPEAWEAMEHGARRPANDNARARSRGTGFAGAMDPGPMGRLM